MQTLGLASDSLSRLECGGIEALRLDSVSVDHFVLNVGDRLRLFEIHDAGPAVIVNRFGRAGLYLYAKDADLLVLKQDMMATGRGHHRIEPVNLCPRRRNQGQRKGEIWERSHTPVITQERWLLYR